MRKLLVLRRLTGSELGWFAVALHKGKARGGQKGINFNAKVVRRIFDGIPELLDFEVRTVRYSDGQAQSRPFKKQTKNWRLVGSMIKGYGLDLVDVGDFFWCIVELPDRGQPTLIWDVVSRKQQSDVHALIVRDFGSQLIDSMAVWDVEENGAKRLYELLGLEALTSENSSQNVGPSSSGNSPSSGKPLRSGSSALRPRARLIQAIGQDLISNEVVALVELIKNAYDADAHSVEIRVNSPLTVGEGAIVVQDDGHGMSLDVLQSAWMEPATISKTKRRFSPGGRRMTGEKGLGRFAAARLARRMELDSIAAHSGRRVVAEFDWEAFSSEDRYLDQIQTDWSEFAVESNIPSGTTLTLSELRDVWDREAFRRLRGELSRLIVRHVETDPFQVALSLPAAYKDLGGPITPPQVLSRPHYSIRGGISESGMLAAALAIGDQERSLNQKIILKSGRVPDCGPFSFNIKVWDRDRDRLGKLALDLGSTVLDVRRDLNEAAGISVYRDLFRVLPYGSPTNDWLRLDLRRVQNPTLRISNNQIVGAIYIGADENPELRDQTNREGFVESSAFGDLRECIGEVLGYLEAARYEVRRKAEKLASQRSLFDELNLAPVREAFSAKYPDDKEFLNFLEEKDRRVKKSVDQIQEVIVRYRRLATLGQLVDAVLHDGRTSISSISSQCELGRRDLRKADISEQEQAKIVKRLETIDAQAVALSGLFRRISPFGGRKRGRPTECLLESLVSDAFAILHDQVDDLGVKIGLPETSTPVRVDIGEVQQVFVNLLTNALYWLSKVPQEKREIVVRVNSKEGGIEVLFSDSGPGIPEEIRDFIFDPYYTTRPDGVGIGLTISGEIVAEYGGNLELIEPGLLDGANFRFTLKTT